jgi:D-alanyl-lipoteichoic acid acyltransferase DltB (MBOAT superfamily)
MGVLSFSGQIFFDFAGYSTCAIGVAACLGFVLPENFLYPYAATGFSDFWRRWHITLSAWLRDYLYIPLGGNRKGVGRTYINLMITMLLGGLWHGANWTFVVWGALHGFYLMAEKFIQDLRPKLKLQPELISEPKVVLRGVSAPRFLKIRPSSNFLYALFTFFLVNVTWVFFRSPDFASAWNMLRAMFSTVPNGALLLSNLTMIKITIIIGGMLGFHWMMRNRRVLSVSEKMPWWLLGIIWAVMLILLILSQESSSSFIYFQF